jgi:dipeptidyl-peptidase-4
MRKLFLAAWIGLVLLLNLQAQENRLTVDRIFGSGEFSAEDFSVNWMPAGGRYFVQEPSASGSGNDIVLVDPVNGKRETLVAATDLIPPGANEPIAVSSFQVSPDGKRVLVFNNSRRVWRYPTRGDYWIADRASGDVRKLGGDDAPESSLMFAKFSPDGSRVAWVREHNIYVERLADHHITQITRTENDDIINGTSDWVYEEELDLRDGFQWSEDGQQIVYWRFDTSNVGVFTMINNTDELYPRLTTFQYPKVGTTNSAVSIGIHDLASGVSRLVDLPGDPRENYPARIHWIPGTSQFLLQRLNRLQNTNTVYAIDAKNGSFRVVMTDQNDAWVDVCDWIEWLSDRQHFTFVSERDGWKHVYLVDLQSGDRQLVTRGDFDVEQLYRIDTEKRECLFLASPTDPACRYLFRQGFDDPQPVRLTPASQTGWHDYRLAADGSSAVHSWSRFGSPPSIETITLPDHQTIAVEVDNQQLRESLAGLSPCPHEFFQLPIDDGCGRELRIDGWAMKPAGFDPSRKYPAIVYVYGEPWGTTVTNQWGGSTYLWHRMMCERGYVILSFDNRGSKVPRGAAWRKAIYKKIGIINASDQAEALRAALHRFAWLDPERIGIWGWSGGGSSTLQALFKYPDLYDTGVSVAPVPDQRYYDTIYQERYMQTPDLNPEGFEKGSAINFAKNLQGNLLLIHGTGDDNCHYQTMELLINELIREDKPFRMMAYPNRSHGIHEYPNTSRHLRKLITEYFVSHLPPGPR